MPPPDGASISETQTKITNRRAGTRGLRFNGPHNAFSAVRLFALLFLLGSLFYFHTLALPFVWDEYRIILGNRAAGSFQGKNLPHLFSRDYFFLPGSVENELPVDLAYYRPVTLFVHALTYQFAGIYFPAYHLESFFLHIGTTLLLFSLFAAVLGASAKDSSNRRVAFLGALIFFVHPRNVETVCIVANQTGLLSSFFSLLSLTLWVRILKGAFRPLVYLMSLAALLCGMLSKEAAYGVPLLHFVLFCLCSRKPRKKNLIFLLAYFLTLSIPLILRSLFLEGPSMGDAFREQISRQGSVLLHLGSVSALFLHQVSEWLFPRDLQLFQYPFSVRDLSATEGFGAAAFLLAVVWLLRRHWALLLFAFMLVFVFYLPSSNLISIGTLPGGTLKAGSHHLYPAHAGFAFLVAGVLLLPGTLWTPRVARRKWAISAWFIAPALVLILSVQTVRFSAYFRTADTFYLGLLERRPSYTGAYVNYAWHKIYIEKDGLEGERILMRGLQMANEQVNSKGEMDLLRSLLVLYIEAGRTTEARTLLECLLDRWSKDTIGSLYLWRIAGLLERAESRPSVCPR